MSIPEKDTRSYRRIFNLALWTCGITCGRWNKNGKFVNQRLTINYLNIHINRTRFDTEIFHEIPEISFNRSGVQRWSMSTVLLLLINQNQWWHSTRSTILNSHHNIKIVYSHTYNCQQQQLVESKRFYVWWLHG